MIEHVSEAGFEQKFKLLEIIRKLNIVINGGGNYSGNVTLTASDTTTTVINNVAGINSVVLLQPTTANAAIAAQTLYIENTVNGFIIHHDNTADVDKTFRYVIIGN